MGIGLQTILGIREADRLKQLEGSRIRLPPRHIPMRFKRFGDLALPREQRIERGARILEDETVSAAVHAAQQSSRRADQLTRALVTGERAAAVDDSPVFASPSPRIVCTGLSTRCAPTPKPLAFKPVTLLHGH